MGRGLPRAGRAEQNDSLEYAELRFRVDGRLCLRAQKRRARFPEIDGSRNARRLRTPPSRPAAEDRAERTQFGPFPRLRRPPSLPTTYPAMVHHVVLCKLTPEVTPARVEEMMMSTRMMLLKIPEVLSI